MPLSAEQIAQYRRDGYVCPVPVMPAAEVTGLRRQLEAFEATLQEAAEAGHLDVRVDDPGVVPFALPTLFLLRGRIGHGEGDSSPVRRPPI